MRCSGRSSSAPTSSLHSTTKYLNGHSDSVGGVVIATRDDDIEWLQFVQNADGAILSPFDSWLVLRGTKTLPVRMAQHNANGLALAEFLAGAPEGDAACSIPGLPDHPQHALAKRADARLRRHARVRPGHRSRRRARVCQPRAADRAGRKPRRRRVADRPPGVDDPRVGAAERRAALGLTDGLVRISAGIEDVEDLLADLEQALG